MGEGERQRFPDGGLDYSHQIRWLSPTRGSQKDEGIAKSLSLRCFDHLTPNVVKRLWRPNKFTALRTSSTPHPITSFSHLSAWSHGRQSIRHLFNQYIVIFHPRSSSLLLFQERQFALATAS